MPSGTLPRSSERVSASRVVGVASFEIISRVLASARKVFSLIIERKKYGQQWVSRALFLFSNCELSQVSSVYIGVLIRYFIHVFIFLF